jgi:hypothetical protein
MTYKIFSFGGGRQSHAVMVMQKRGMVHYDEFTFSNVGDDSENPGTLEYIENVTKPYCHENGIKFTVLDGKRTLYNMMVGDIKTVPIPVYMENGAPGRRQCTNLYKRNRIASYIKKLGGGIVGLGISLDEYQRMRTDSGIEWVINDYPLIDAKMTLSDCRKLIADEGLPEPEKSSCYFCPYHSITGWRRLRDEHPDLFEKAVGIEKRLNEKRASFGKDNVYLTRFLRPLDQVIGEQDGLFEQPCDSGYCMV